MGQVDSTCAAPTRGASTSRQSLARGSSIRNPPLLQRYKLTHVKANFETRISHFRLKD
jgi:hypothetical protein